MSRKRPSNGECDLPIVGTAAAIPDDQEGCRTYPTLSDVLYPRYRNGKCVRTSGRLSVRLSGSYFVITVHAPSEGLQTTMVLTSLVGLLENVECRLCDPAIVWLPDFDSTKKARQEARR